MKILWITNTIFPDVCKELNMPIPVIGGWMHSGAMSLLNNNKNIELAVATTFNGDDLKEFCINGITYFLLPNKGIDKKYQPYLESFWKKIKIHFQPDVIHIHGTEYPHGLAYIRACGNKNVIVSIQGLISVYEKYYFGGIAEKVIKKNITIRDIITRDSMRTQQLEMRERGLLEKEYIKSIDYVIGRTFWDKTHVWAINPTLQYHFCNETLRNGFYNLKWNINTCEKNSIFLSQAYYPIKGLQQIIKALPVILKHYPNTKLYIAGSDFLTNKGLRLNGFGKYIKSLIKNNNLPNVIRFTGTLSEEKMAERFLLSHVFVCPSSIENSPNSIGEAQLLGVPCVASFVGGIPDMVKHGETGFLYRFEEIEMLAAEVCKLFSDDMLANEISLKEMEAAHCRHNKIINAQTLNNIYTSICSHV